MNLLKQSKKQFDIEKNYVEIIKQKEEEIKKLKEENMKINNILSQMKSDIDKVNIEKNQEKELQNLKDEIGVIEIIDVNKLLNIKKKFSLEDLKIQRGIEHNYNRNQSNTSNNEIISDKKKKKKKKIESKKENEQNGSDTKLCKKIKKAKMNESNINDILNNKDEE